MKRGTVYNNFYTDEKWKLVNQENKEIMEDFLEELEATGRKISTINGYRQDLRIIFIWIMETKQNKSVLELKKKDFRNMSLFFTKECGMSAARVNRLKSAINSMLTFCEDDDEYDYEVNYAKKIAGRPKEPVRVNDDNFFFTFEEFIQVRDILVEKGRLQDAVLWSVGFDSAARKNELHQIKKDGLTDDGVKYTNFVMGKRGKRFKLGFLSDTKELIKKYLEERGEDDVESLWYKEVKGVRQEVSVDWIYQRIVSISKILSEIRGYECHIFPHTMRHSRAEVLTQGADNRMKDKNGNNRVYSTKEAAKALHHESEATTEGYIKNHEDDILDEMYSF